MENAPPAGAIFPVFLSDGDRETLIGTVLVHPSLRFHDLKLTIARQIGVAPNQFTIFFADHRDPRPWFGKVAVTPKFDFAAATAVAVRARREGARCRFLVVPKRSRRERRKGGGNEPENPMLLLRRDHSLGNPNQSQILPDQRVIGFPPAVVEKYRKLQADRERYLMMSAALEELRRQRSTSQGVCEKCEEEKGSAAGCPSAFHCCQNDPMIAGFRTRAGPIVRPVERPMSR